MPLLDGFQLAPEFGTEGPQCQSLFYDLGEINMEAARDVHPLKSIGCFIKKPITAEQLIKRIKAQLRIKSELDKQIFHLEYNRALFDSTLM